MSKYQFEWSFPKNVYLNIVDMEKNDDIDDGFFVGSCRAGDLCFDLVGREVEGGKTRITLCYDLYVGGIDTGYGYSHIEESHGYPYTEADGGWLYGKCQELPYEEFLKYAEEQFAEYIEHSTYTESMNLVEKANAPLHVW